MRAWKINVDAVHNNLPVFGAITVSDNRLGAISTVADDQDVLFRWEGDLCRIFDRGELTTDPNLRESKISSSVSIKDSYARVKVKGLHDVNSGWVKAENAPNYLDDRKLIEDQSLETEAGCVARAKRFIRKNGNVKYKGKITTNSTFAPVGELMDGSHFSHGQDMLIKSVKYGMNRSTIELGLEKNVATELIGLSTGNKKEDTRVTSNNMKVPSGDDVFQ
jgi:hypothetical protein